MTHDDHITFPLPGAPDSKKAAAAFASLCRTIAALRDSEHGCPWDREQDHASLRRYMLEEAYEAVDVMGGNTPAALCDELGDVLLQVVLNAQVALDHNTFSIVEVVTGLDEKMKRRHPHVFGSDDQRQKRGKDALHQSWQEIKKAEKKAAAPEASPTEDPFVGAGVKKVRPATSQAHRIGTIAARINFDWGGVGEVWQKFLSEVDELASELDQRSATKLNQRRIEDEIGDLYFTLAQLCRHLELEPEVMAQQGNQKFLGRFAILAQLAEKKGIKLASASQATLESLWLEAKVAVNGG